MQFLNKRSKGPNFGANIKTKWFINSVCGVNYLFLMVWAGALELVVAATIKHEEGSFVNAILFILF